MPKSAKQKTRAESVTFCAEPVQARKGKLRRAVALVYRSHNGQRGFLLVSASRERDRMVIPGGLIESHESPEATAIRETREEAGVQCAVERHIGQYLHRKGDAGKQLWTSVYLARFQSEHRSEEDRAVLWVRAEELAHLGNAICPVAAQFIEHADRLLTGGEKAPDIAA